MIRRSGRCCDHQQIPPAVFSAPPTLHRPGSMAKRVRALGRTAVERYDGDLWTVWTWAADGKDLLGRVSALPGFGTLKAAAEAEG